MPSASDRSGGEFKPLPAAPRYLRRNAARAMAGYLVRGLVELLTNSRDSAYRLFAKKLIDERSLASEPRLVIPGHDPAVFDRFPHVTDRVVRIE